MKILLICGSMAENSHTRSILQVLEELFKKEGFDVHFWDLMSKPLPPVIPDYHRDPTKHPDEEVRNFVEIVKNCRIIVLGSPLYHGSYSGVLKNALDNLHWDALRYKWIGLVGNAGSPRANHIELLHLRQVVNTLFGYCAQTQIGTCGTDYSELKGDYVLTNEEVKDRCQRLVTELVGQVKGKD